MSQPPCKLFLTTQTIVAIVRAALERVSILFCGYLDREAIAFVDCKPNRGRGKQALLN